MTGGKGASTAAFVRDRTLVIIGVVAVIIVTMVRLSLLNSAVVVYCAHDSVFADSILRDFEQKTGVKLAIKYDTEATKSLGLVELLLAEKDAPRCDLFWNNELLGTAELAERGLLAPYRGSGWERIPAQWKDPDGRWGGFGARLRVHISNTKETHGEITPGSTALLEPARFKLGANKPPLARTAIAKPLYGTTLTHYTVLWARWGPDQLKAWHHEVRELGLREVNGNGAVKDLVAQGACDSGLTDTDDFFDAKDAKAPVAMAPVRFEDGATICIPNTVAVINGAPHAELARHLADYLLSAETELALAKSKSRQIPLGPVDENQLPAEVRELRGWSAKSVSLMGLVKARADCLAWLKAQYSE